MNFAEVFAQIESFLPGCSVTLDQLIERRGGMYVELTRIAYITVCLKNDIPMDTVAEHLNRNRSTIYRHMQRHDDYMLTSSLYRRIYGSLSKFSMPIHN